MSLFATGVSMNIEYMGLYGENEHQEADVLALVTSPPLNVGIIPVAQGGYFYVTCKPGKVIVVGISVANSIS